MSKGSHIKNFPREAKKDFDKAYDLMIHEINEAAHKAYCLIAIEELKNKQNHK